MSEQDDIIELTRQLLKIHIDRERLATEERAILERLAKLASSDSSIEKERSRVKQEKRQNGEAKKDRFGNTLRVGDKVEFLTKGKFESKVWTVYRLTEKRVLCEKKSTGQRTHREYQNVRRVTS